jgi:hypothetical protein
VRALSIEAAEAELAAVTSREHELELDLEKLYNRAVHLCQSESRNLAHASERHKEVPAAIGNLQETLEQTSSVADELSSRVRKLDVTCNRVDECSKLVQEMLEVGECSEHISKAILSEDYERAAKYVARFRASQGHLPPGTDEASIRTMREAEVQLTAIVRKRFEGAMNAADSAEVSRFAKLFHPLGIASEGVQKYVDFIRKSLAEKCSAEFRALAPSMGKKAEADSMPYSQALMSVFLGIADIVQEHKNAVEDQFGPENFLVVIRGLLMEADAQGLKVVDKFCKDNASVFDNASRDMLQVGIVLQEATLITQRTQQFSDYIHNMAAEVVAMIADKNAFKANLPEGHAEIDGLPELTDLMHRIQELVSSYVRVEENFLLKSVTKAIKETDCLDPHDADAKTTTLVDDAFFILQESLRRAISTCDINAACAVVNNVSACISNEMKDALTCNIVESKRTYGAWVTHAKNFEPSDNPLFGMFLDPDPKGEGKLRSPLTSACSWPHSLNNIQQSIENIDMLKEAAEREFNEYFPPGVVEESRRVMFQHCVSALDATKGELDALHTAKCKEGLQMLKVQLSPSLQPLDTISYELDENQYEDFQVNDPFASAFNANADLIYQHLKSVLNPACCDEIMQNMAEQTCTKIERTAIKKRFSLFGALQFESDVRAVCSFFTNISEQALRHKFARLFEMAGLLSLETLAELREHYSETRSWRLTGDEIRKLVAARIDFRATEADFEGLHLPN